MFSSRFDFLPLQLAVLYYVFPNVERSFWLWSFFLHQAARVLDGTQTGSTSSQNQTPEGYIPLCHVLNKPALHLTLGWVLFFLSFLLLVNESQKTPRCFIVFSLIWSAHHAETADISLRLNKYNAGWELGIFPST